MWMNDNMCHEATNSLVDYPIAGPTPYNTTFIILL